MSVSGPYTGFPCIFPFTLGDVTYTECFAHSSGKLCSTQVGFYLFVLTFKESSPNISRLTMMVTWSIGDIAVMTVIQHYQQVLL